MQNPITNAIREIQMTIPQQVLTEVFGKEYHGSWRRQAPVSIDEMIRSKVIRPRVLKDCNLIGGREVMIPLEGVPYTEQNPFTISYNIPNNLTGNREIISVLSVNYLPLNVSGMAASGLYGSSQAVSYSDAASVGQRVMDASSSVAHVSTASAEIIGYNTVIVRDTSRPVQPYTLRCVLSNDENLSNLQPRSHRDFAKACILATKSFIYNELVIRIGQGMLEQGQELGRFREIVDQYSDSEEMYQQFLTETLQKVLFMNDSGAYEKYITLQLNPGL